MLLKIRCTHKLGEKLLRIKHDSYLVAFLKVFDNMDESAQNIPIHKRICLSPSQELKARGHEWVKLFL